MIALDIDTEHVLVTKNAKTAMADFEAMSEKIFIRDLFCRD
jgi:hypothetical protein